MIKYFKVVSNIMNKTYNLHPLGIGGCIGDLLKIGPANIRNSIAFLGNMYIFPKPDQPW